VPIESVRWDESLRMNFVLFSSTSSKY
jgi:hypothetical protein